MFFDEHVVADAVHENLAAVDLAGGLVRQDPSLCASVLWGARVLARLESGWAAHLLDAWSAGRSSLRDAQGALNPTSLCVPSQKGRVLDFPQRHSATGLRPVAIGAPSGVSSRTGPRTTSGPSR